jgi:hypothetical protein
MAIREIGDRRVPHVNEILFLAPREALYCVKHGLVKIERFIVLTWLHVHITKLVEYLQSFHVVSF